MSKKIAGERLKPKTDLFPSDLDALAVDSFGPKCSALLRKTGWRDLAAGFIGLALGSDNRRVLLTNIYLVGRLHKSEQAVTTVKASKFWPKVPAHVELRLPLENLAVFSFDGSLQSELVSSAGLSYETWDPESEITIPKEDFIKMGGGEFTMRIFAQMTAPSWCKISFALLPIKKEELLKLFPYAKNPLFPWIRVESVEVALLPNADKLYGLPFSPLVQKGKKDEPFPVFPSFEWREKIACLLQTAVAPRWVPDGLKLDNKLKKLTELEDKAEGSLVPAGSLALLFPDALPSPLLDSGERSATEGRKTYRISASERMEIEYRLCQITVSCRLPKKTPIGYDIIS